MMLAGGAMNVDQPPGVPCTSFRFRLWRGRAPLGWADDGSPAMLRKAETGKAAKPSRLSTEWAQRDLNS